MFKFRNLIFFVLCISLLTACSKDDDNGGNSVTIIGTWTAESIKITIDEETFDFLDELLMNCPVRAEATSSFNEDGTGLGENKCQGEVVESYEFTYEFSADGKMLILTQSGESNQYNVDQFTSSRLVLSQEETIFGFTAQIVETWIRN
ncbi:MAG: hypothetical protein EA409_13795 [Saprospirales bacterium]|nr:MAG: hypothetical protein EA409_13795 [Saprospirales bacterium]